MSDTWVNTHTLVWHVIQCYLSLFSKGCRTKSWVVYTLQAMHKGASAVTAFCNSSFTNQLIRVAALYFLSITTPSSSVMYLQKGGEYPIFGTVKSPLIRGCERHAHTYDKKAVTTTSTSIYVCTRNMDERWWNARVVRISCWILQRWQLNSRGSKQTYHCAVTHLQSVSGTPGTSSLTPYLMSTYEAHRTLV